MSEKGIEWRQGLGEGLIVLIGILLALAADAWWDQRQELKRELEYLVALRDDLRENQRRLSESLAQHERHRDASQSLLEMASTGTPAVPDSLQSLLTVAARLGTFSPAMAAESARERVLHSHRCT